MGSSASADLLTNVTNDDWRGVLVCARRIAASRARIVAEARDVAERAEGELDGVLGAHPAMRRPRGDGGEDFAVEVQAVEHDEPAAGGWLRCEHRGGGRSMGRATG